MEHKEIALKTLKKYFGYDEFRSPQAEIIEEILSGRNASVIMPTGGGKSVCYQVPALILEGVAIIITPIIALMQDQVNSLKELGIKAECLNSDLDWKGQEEVMQQVKNGEIKLLYISPEKLLVAGFYNQLKQLNVSLFAIDESHCVSQWGHSFRKDYLNLGILAQDFPKVPRIALTATANDLTRNEIRNNLSLTNDKEFVGSFDRPNITYNIESKADEKEQLIKYIKNNHKEESGIVYCMTRKRVEEFAKMLSDKGYNAYPYHAGLSTEVRKDNLNTFLKEEKIIIVATIAFGMGIDKPNVRFVCHLDLPASIEAYYQETGRAGRDGEPSVAWMLYGVEDIANRRRILASAKGDEQHKRLEKNNVDAMFSLCEVAHCRRKVLMGYFGDELEKKCGNCDNCFNPPQTFDASLLVQKALSAIGRTGQRFGVDYIVNILLGNETPKNKVKKHHELTVFGIGKDHTESEWKTIFRQLIVLGYIDINPVYGSLILSEKCRPILKGEEKIELGKQITQQGKISRFSRNKNSFTVEDAMLFQELKDLRMKLARSKGLAPYMIFNDESLKDMVALKPVRKPLMLSVSGVGDIKFKNYGQDFMDVIIKNMNNSDD
jgi:ATP-dependent DNA helicase RecQ